MGKYREGEGKGGKRNKKGEGKVGNGKKRNKKGEGKVGNGKRRNKKGEGVSTSAARL